MSINPNGVTQMTNSDEEAILFITIVVFLFVVGLIIHFIPWLIGKKRNVAMSCLLFWLNATLGWTVIGWCICLLWATQSQTKDQEALRNAS
jgi:hypothetical protein